MCVCASSFLVRSLALYLIFPFSVLYYAFLLLSIFLDTRELQFVKCLFFSLYFMCHVLFRCVRSFALSIFICIGKHAMRCMNLILVSAAMSTHHPCICMSTITFISFWFASAFMPQSNSPNTRFSTFSYPYKYIYIHNKARSMLVYSLGLHLSQCVV